MDYLNNIAALLAEVAGNEYAEYVYKALDLAKPLLPTSAAEVVDALVDVARTLEKSDIARKAEIQAVLDDAQTKAQAIADAWK